MLILEYSQYDKYLSNNDFMVYFNTIKEKVLKLFPQYNTNLELIIDKIYYCYQKEMEINDVINALHYNGNILQYNGSMEL